MDIILNIGETKKFLGQAIKYLRKKEGLTQEGISYPRIELDEKYIGRIERGEIDIQLSTLSKICKGLNISHSKLFAIAEEFQKGSLDEPME